MTSDNERAFEEFNIAELAAESMLNHKALMWLSHDTIQTIRTALQRDDSVVEEMAKALYDLCSCVAYGGSVVLTDMVIQQARAALSKFNASRGKT